MPELPRITGKEAIKAFELAGWTLDRVKGSHYILINPGCVPLSIPVHGKEILKPGLLKGQINNAGLTVEEFIDLLKEI